MIRLTAIAFALTLATSAQATTPLAPLQGPDGMITQVRQNCGAGMRWNNALGRCATTSARASRRTGEAGGPAPDTPRTKARGRRSIRACRNRSCLTP